MICERCHGLMVSDHPLIFQSKADYRADGVDLRAELSAWRCVCCGNVVDPVIVRNRQAKQTSRPLRYMIRNLQPVQIAAVGG